MQTDTIVCNVFINQSITLQFISMTYVQIIIRYKDYIRKQRILNMKYYSIKISKYKCSQTSPSVLKSHSTRSCIHTVRQTYAHTKNHRQPFKYKDSQTAFQFYKQTDILFKETFVHTHRHLPDTQTATVSSVGLNSFSQRMHIHIRGIPYIRSRQPGNLS